MSHSLTADPSGRPAEGTTHQMGVPVPDEYRAATPTRRLDTRMKLIGGGVIAAALIAIAMTATSKPGPETVTESLLKGLANRDADASQLLTTDTDLGPIADRLGFAILPQSVTVTLDDLRRRQVEGRSTDDEATVIAEWSAVASASGGELARTQQTATVQLVKSPTSAWQVSDIDVPVALAFDIEGYAGTGSTMAARDAAIADLATGTAWLDGIAIEATDSVETVTLEPIVANDPDRFDWEEQVTSVGRYGEITHWGIAISGLRTQSFEVANAETVVAEPQQITRGTLTEASVMAEAMDAARTLVRGMDDGSFQEALDDGPVITEAAFTRMAVDPPALDPDEAFLVQTEPSIQVRVDDLLLVRQNGGIWTIDTAGSSLIVDWLSGSGPDLKVTQRRALVDFTACGEIEDAEAEVTFHFDGIEFLGGPEPSVTAIFTANATGDLECADGTTLEEVVVSWQGGSERVDAIGESGRTPQTIYVDLPSTVQPDSGPIRLDVAIGELGFDRRTGARGVFVAGE